MGVYGTHGQARVRLQSFSFHTLFGHSLRSTHMIFSNFVHKLVLILTVCSKYLRDLLNFNYQPVSVATCVSAPH